MNTEILVIAIIYKALNYQKLKIKCFLLAGFCCCLVEASATF